MTNTETKWAVSYVDARDGKRYARVDVQRAGESYEAFAARARHSACCKDFAVRDVSIKSLRGAVLDGLLPSSVL